ncbi:MAG TPA: peptide-N-glycosidase F-related protein [Phycisphaerae bacterium]|nr:hypothetical protein [Phycisphaerales bacterium]HRX83856.1 peptide-N-glycosidase F-related protein [Phycisphaerae bacterium]
MSNTTWPARSKAASLVHLLGILAAASAAAGLVDDADTPPDSAGATVSYAFAGTNGLAGWTVQATGEAEKRMPAPRIEDGKLYLLESWWRSTAAAAAPAPTDHRVRTIDVAWTLVMNTGTEGMGFAWLDVARYGTKAEIPPPLAEEAYPGPGGNPGVVEYDWGWEAPSLLDAFGVGFDASDPANRDPFRGSGNTYDRPQHEVSLHWNGLEIVKRVSTVEFRDEKPHRVKLHIAFVTGGADVSLAIDDEPQFTDYFIPSMTAFVGRPVFGSRNTDTAGDVLIDDVAIGWAGEIPPPQPPLNVVALDHVLNDVDHRSNAAEVHFPDDTDRFGRIICTLRLDKPESRFDPWDRIAHLWIESPGGSEKPERFELLRYITPYHRGHVWRVDVSDFRPLLIGTQRLVQECGTQGEGWVVSVSFDFYPGPPEDDRFATRVINLWSGSPEIGNPDKPVEAFYQQRTVTLPPATTAAKVRVVVTGHGMTPNSGNAGEFMPLGRTLTVNDQAQHNVLWKTDNYLNPCRPQGGTWKYDRAGWAPGDVVHPWLVNVAPRAVQAGTLTIDYALDPYVNENRGQTWAPTHVTEAQLIVYGPAR